MRSMAIEKARIYLFPFFTRYIAEYSHHWDRQKLLLSALIMAPSGYAIKLQRGKSPFKQTDSVHSRYLTLYTL